VGVKQYRMLFLNHTSYQAIKVDHMTNDVQYACDSVFNSCVAMMQYQYVSFEQRSNSLSGWAINFRQAITPLYYYR